MLGSGLSLALFGAPREPFLFTGTSSCSSSDRNSRLLKALLKISSVRDEPDVFRGELSSALWAAFCENLCSHCFDMPRWSSSLVFLLEA